MQIRSKVNSTRRSIVIAALASLLMASLAGPVNASSTDMGWSFFTTGTWEPTINWPVPDDAEVKGTSFIEGTIAKGTTHETKYYVYDSGEKGPTVVVVGGVHGDEPAGAKAALQAKDYSVKKGKLVVIPEANKPALKKGTRTSSLGDLNRDFPRTSSESADTYLAKGIWEVMTKYKPNWLIDMHEGYSYHKVNSESVGQSVIYYPNSGAASVAKAMAAAASKTVTVSSHTFSVLKYPVAGSLARAVSIRFGTNGMIVETCDKQTLSLRVSQHLAALNAMLSALGMR